MVALAVPGLGGLVRSELRSLDGVTVGQYGNDSRADLVLFERASDARVDDIRTAEDLLVEIGRGRRSDGDNPRWIAGRIWKGDRARRAIGSRVDGRATFRVIVRVLQERSFRRTALREAFTDLIQRDCPRWSFADPAEIEIWVLEYRPGAFVAGVRVSDVRMRQHGGRDSERRGALRPTVAAAMVGLAGKARGGLLDPCCGSGTILEEATSAGWRAAGSDTDPAAVRATVRNAHVPVALADARRLPVADGAVAACVSNLPFGQQYEVEGDPTVWLDPRARRDDAGHAAVGPRRRARPRRRQARGPEGAPRDPAHADRAARDEDDDLELRAHVKGVALLGPTSSGKTGLSLELAARLRAQGRRPVVLNADSRQVYRYMDIGTSKIARRDMQGIEHRLLDIVEPTRPLPLERYAAEARRALDDLLVDPDAVPIVVGGTGTYVRAIVDGWNLAGTSTTRRDLEREFPRGEVGEAHRMLQRIAPDVATRVSARDYEGTLNALVRAMHPDEGGGGGGQTGTPGYEWTVVAVDRKPAGARTAGGGDARPAAAVGPVRRGASARRAVCAHRGVRRGAALRPRTRCSTRTATASSSSTPGRKEGRSRS